MADRAMGTFFVVVSAPILHLRSGIVKRQEPVSVQTLGPELAVEGFDKRIVRWLAGSAEVQSDAVRVGPQVEIA